MESLKNILRQPVWLYTIIFALLLAVHAFIFRDVLAAIPDILAGNASIVREELVPFFNFGTQFWGDNTSALTSSEEVRVSYSFWTAWVRYDIILPFALVVLNAISAFILFYAFHRLGRHFYRKSLFGVLAALLAAFLIHMILLYAKVAHFYVLIIGFSMFALSISLFIEQLFFGKRLSKANVAAVTLLMLFNPAIHYHVIFYIVALIVVVAHLIVTFVMNRRYFWKYVRRDLLYCAIITLLSLVPYVIYIALVTQPSSDVSTQIPVNYWMMYYASLSLPFIFSLDTAGHIDLIKYGNYFAPLPRFGTMVVTFLVASIFLYKRWRKLQPIYQVCLLTIFMLMLFAMWMTIGYSENSPYSFHMVIGNLALFFASIGGVIGDGLANVLQLFINILRFPHRFQFIYFYAAGVLLMVALVWLYASLKTKIKPAFAGFLVVLIALFPLIGSGDYRGAMFSGDLAKFAQPYHIPDDLKNIKQELKNHENSKLFVLPTLESGREILQDDKRYSFLDKYLIYYLNQPTLYYGVGANTENKIIAYMAYRAIAYDEPWWQQILANTLGITDILVPSNIEPRDTGLTYMRGIEKHIDTSLAASTMYEPTYEGEDFSLYSLRAPVATDQSTLVDMNWQNMLKYLMGDEAHEGVYYFPLQLRKFLESEGKKYIATDSPERSFYDIYSLKADRVFVPRPVSLPFSSEYVASSNFTNNALSLSVLQSKTDQYNYLHEVVPSLVNLQRTSFVGLTQGNTQLPVEIKASAEGKYRVLLHGGSKSDAISAVIDGQEVKLQKVVDDRNQPYDYLDITYFYADVDLKAGTHEVAIQNTDQSGIIVDSVMLMPTSDIPASFDVWLAPTAQKDVYEVRME
jgi:hypothetical protein